MGHKSLGLLGPGQKSLGQSRDFELWDSSPWDKNPWDWQSRPMPIPALWEFSRTNFRFICLSRSRQLNFYFHFYHYKDCSAVNLNGLYHGSRTEKNTFDVKTGERTHPYPPNDGAFWRHRSKKWNSLRSTKMFIAPVEVKEYPCMFDS